MLLNEIKRIFVHIRWPLQSYTLLGFLFGIVVSNVSFSVNLVLGFVSWFCLCSEITLFNSYYDKDKGPVAGLEKPPKTTKSMFIGAWMFKFLGLIIAVFLNAIFLGVYVLGIFLSILYSHKRFRFKSNGYVAVLFNFIMGAITFIIASSFAPINTIILGFGATTAGLFLASIYMMMQIHQKNEDKERGDISIAVLFGKKKTLISALVLLVFATIFAVISLFLTTLPEYLIFAFLAFFLIVIILIFLWLRKKEDSVTDFKTMNRLTLNLSYVANILLILIYIIYIA